MRPAIEGHGAGHRPLDDTCCEQVVERLEGELGGQTSMLSTAEEHDYCVDLMTREQARVLTRFAYHRRLRWESRLPAALGELARAKPASELFDSIVVDEAQDFGEDWWPPTLDSLRDRTNGGLFVFLDEAQRVFARRGVVPGEAAPILLDENVRNTHRIAQTFASLSGETLGFRGSKGPRVRFVACSTGRTVEAADDAVDGLLDDGWAAGDIALLTTGHRHPKQRNAVDLGGWHGYWDAFFAREDVFYGHVLGFKGLERPVVVLAANGVRDPARAREMLYVGLSRARTQLLVCGTSMRLPRSVARQCVNGWPRRRRLSMVIDDAAAARPLRLLLSGSIGREEYCQRLLTMLVIGAPYPLWNTRNAPSARGLRFLADLQYLCFDDARLQPDLVFVDEFELPRRHEDERGGAPDSAVLWSDRVWMIELKTERASHRPRQLSGYLELGRHHYPTAAIDLAYITPAMPEARPPLGPDERFAHVTWTEVIPLVDAVWSAVADATERQVAGALLTAIGRLGEPVLDWRSSLAVAVAADVAEPLVDSGSGDLVSDALRQADVTAATGMQMALDWLAPSLEELQELRLEVRGRLAATPPH